MSYADKLIPIQPSQSTSSYKSKLIPIQSERGKRITQGLPVSSDRRFERTGEATPNFGGEIARSIIKPIARLGQNITGKMDDSGKIDSRQSNYLGTIKPVGNSGDFGKDVLDSIGVGAEIGSNLIGGTGAGAVAKTGLKGLVKQGVTTGARAGIGAGATYGLGAGLQDQKDKNVGQILGNTAIQTVKGGAIGGLAGGVLGGAVAPIVKPSILLPKSSATKAVSKTENELLKIENNYQKLRKNAKFSKDGNAATRKRIAQTGVMTDATDDTGTIITDKIIPKYRALSPINNTEGVVRKNLERLGETVDLDTVENKLLKSVYDSGLQGANLESAVNTVKKEIAGYRLRANPDGRVPLTLMHDAKIDVYNSIDFNTSAEIKAYKKILAKGLKEVVEENSSFNVKEVNETLAPYLKDIEYLESLNGRKVKGGKLGKYSARIAGNIAGGIAGGSVGGLPGSAVGTIVGGEVGDVIQGKILKNTFGRTAETALPESKILKKAVQTGNSPRLQLPAGNKDAPRIRIESGRTINLPKRTQSTADAQSLANLKAQKIAPPSNIPSKVSISKTIPEKKTKPKLSLKDNRGFIATGYKETGNLTTKILKDLEGKTTGLRNGQPPLGSDWNEVTKTRINLEETVARERFDIPKLEKLSFGGSDRDVYLLPSGEVLKVAKNSRGLTQNASSADYYAEGAELIPKTIEQGKNYLVKEFIGKPDANTKAMIAELKKLDVIKLNGKMGGGGEHQKEVVKAIDILNKYGYAGDDLMNYQPLWGDMVAVRNWGTKEGKPILLDEGTLNGDLVLKSANTRGSGLSSDPEFRNIYNQSKTAKKKFGDLDKKTMYSVAGSPLFVGAGTGLAGAIGAGAIKKRKNGK